VEKVTKCGEAMTKARTIEETLKKVQEESQEVTKLKDVLKKPLGTCAIFIL